MKTLIFLTIFLTGCLTTNLYNKDGTVNCNKAPSLWWGEKGSQPTSEEVKALCDCNDWQIEAR